MLQEQYSSEIFTYGYLTLSLNISGKIMRSDVFSSLDFLQKIMDTFII